MNKKQMLNKALKQLQTPDDDALKLAEHYKDCDDVTACILTSGDKKLLYQVDENNLNLLFMSFLLSSGKKPKTIAKELGITVEELQAVIENRSKIDNTFVRFLKAINCKIYVIQEYAEK